MVHSCFLCKITSEKDSSVSFHRFPKNELQRQKWLKTLNIQEKIITTSTKLCSRHFPEDSFRIREGGRRDLKPSACPTGFYPGNYSDDSIVPEEVGNSGLESKDDFTMFLTDNLDLFPDHILKTDYLEGNDIFLNESMETEVLDNLTLDPILSEKLPLMTELQPEPSTKSNDNTNSLEMDKLLNKIQSDNNFKWRAYFKQCTIDDFSTPEMARRNIELGKKEIETHQKKIKILQQQNRRLKCRVQRLKQLLKKFKKNCNEEFSDDDDEEEI